MSELDNIVQACQEACSGGLTVLPSADQTITVSLSTADFQSAVSAASFVPSSTHDEDVAAAVATTVDGISTISHISGSLTAAANPAINMMCLDDSVVGESELSDGGLDDNGDKSLMSLHGLAKKRKRPWSYESNPATRKRQSTRLMRKIKSTIDELAARVGLQAVVISCSPARGHPPTASQTNTEFKVFGAAPLENVIKRQRHSITQALDMQMMQHQGGMNGCSQKYDLPPLVVDGVTVSVEKMTQAQLRAFIPPMLRCSTGRPKPGWGKDHLKPVWWPDGVPWQNVRADMRTDIEKQQTQWTEALRQIVRNCYTHHNRLDLLVEANDQQDGGGIGVPKNLSIPQVVGVGTPSSSLLSTELDNQQQVSAEQQAQVIMDLTHNPHIIQHIQAADGTTMLLPQYLDSRIVVELTEANSSVVDVSTASMASMASMSSGMFVSANPHSVMTSDHSTSLTALTERDALVATGHLMAQSEAFSVVGATSDVLTTASSMGDGVSAETVASVMNDDVGVPVASEAVEIITVDSHGTVGP
ncbi:nuclear respiratory factor 1-like [Sycon ciliatum]|uniref:nuclear respiratory factor 1-like n=1 Tax=Sycon ciliatum TaxID=27933 RepID=UPI0031F63BDE